MRLRATLQIGSIARSSRGRRNARRLRVLHEVAERGCELGVAGPRRVLVAERGLGRRVAHPVHELSRRGTRRGGDRVRGVSEIMEAEAGRETDGLPGCRPVLGEDMATQGSALLAGKHAVAGSAPLNRARCSSSSLEQEVGQHERPGTGFALRRSEHELAVGELLLLLLDRDRVVEQVHVAPLQTEQFTDSKPDETRDQHEDSVAVVDAFGDVPNLLSGRDRPLGGPLDARALHDARIAEDELVGDGGREDRAQKPVALRRGVRTEAEILS